MSPIEEAGTPAALERTFGRRLLAARLFASVGWLAVAVGFAQQYAGWVSRDLAVALLPLRWPAFFVLLVSFAGFVWVYRCPGCSRHLGAGLSTFKSCAKCGRSFAPR